MKTRSGSAGKEKAPALQLQAREPDQVESGACPRQQMVAVAAYFRAEHRGFAPDNEISDWLEAEADVEDLLRHSH
ncbi:MAG: DUF2934 domain-containing protein [Betaproteobacteria bacterium]|nr:DUF2934 domain-containing protein [Rhodocyclales bacterium]